ncbi:unannotated protein [freshwater metagenome]|uniref:Unannotated protein n=1 Tax=freshwater metagenome TaxID=449393 RepID=A0A6J7I7E0_9ZZZZ
MLSDAHQCLCLDGGSSALGDVIGNDREIGGIGNRQEVLRHALLRRSVVIGSDDHERICTSLRRLSRDLHRVQRVVVTDSGHHVRPVPDRIDYNSE